MQKGLQENKSDDGDICSRSQTNDQQRSPKNVGVKKQNRTKQKTATTTTTAINCEK